MILALGVLAVTLVPRMGINVARLHPQGGDIFRLLVVVDADVEPAELRSAARLRKIGRRTEVRVVAPVVASTLHFLAADEGHEQAEAERRLQTTLRVLAAAGIEAEGVVGTDDPLQAVGDVLPQFAADEILFVGSLPGSRDWSERHFEARARDLFGVPVSTVYGTTAPAGPPVVGAAA